MTRASKRSRARDREDDLRAIREDFRHLLALVANMHTELRMLTANSFHLVPKPDPGEARRAEAWRAMREQLSGDSGFRPCSDNEIGTYPEPLPHHRARRK